MSTETAPREASARPVVYPTLNPSGEAEGFTRGHAAGYAAGLRRADAELAARRAELDAEHAEAVEHGRTQLRAAVALLEGAAFALAERTAPVLEEADAQLAAAAIALAEAVIGHELSDAPTGARAALARALSGRDADAVVAVRLNPADLALLEPGAGPSRVALVPDPAVGRGDAVSVYPDGELDARIGSALVRARAALAGGAE
ncbi:FliH/SctL family protein [Sinomonas sp. P47F7]|uniref:FliH/SctL family protein n=1 Tax=Sinomonas sp. P47F7 TaxID=3410987 RepID=UPI003BF4BD67